MEGRIYGVVTGVSAAFPFLLITVYGHLVPISMETKKFES